MIEAGIVMIATVTVGAVIRAADKWGDRETYTAQTWATDEARRAAQTTIEA